MTQAWEYCQAKPIQTLGSASQGVNWSWSQCIKSHHAEMYSGKGLPSHFSKVLFSDKSKFCFSIGNQGLESGGRLERHRIQAAWSPVWSFWSRGLFGVAWHLMVLVHCVLSSPKPMQPSTRKCLEHFMLPSADKLYGDADFLFQQDFSTCPLCQNHFWVFCWPWYYCAWLAFQHAWPEPHMESMEYFQEKDEKHSIQQSRGAEGSIVPHQCHRLIASMPHFTDVGICAKGAPTKYWVYKWTYFKELELFCFANPFFDWS